MIKKIIDYFKFRIFFKRFELTDKQFLLEIANALDNAKYDEKDIAQFTRKFAESVSTRLRKIGNRMVIK